MNKTDIIYANGNRAAGIRSPNPSGNKMLLSKDTKVGY